MVILRLLILLTLSSCCLKREVEHHPPFLVVLTDARRLDYSSNSRFFSTLAKHPSDWSKNGDVGHAWIWVEGFSSGQKVVITGGHSGELGRYQPKYLEGVIQLIEEGDPNPCRYLWTTRNDGYFEEGGGYHFPTFAAKVPLTDEQFDQICRWISKYPFSSYSITKKQCCTFAAEALEIAGVEADYLKTMDLDQWITIGGKRYRLWQDPVYSKLTFGSPDVLEDSLREKVERGEAQDVTCLMQKRLQKSFKEKCNHAWEALLCFPHRIRRALFWQ